MQFFGDYYLHFPYFRFRYVLFLLKQNKISMLNTTSFRSFTKKNMRFRGLTVLWSSFELDCVVRKIIRSCKNGISLSKHTLTHTHTHTHTHTLPLSFLVKRKKITAKAADESWQTNNQDLHLYISPCVSQKLLSIFGLNSLTTDTLFFLKLFLSPSF